MVLEPGQTLLHYRLVERIGEGGMGVVWKAVDTDLDREVAIKVLPDAFVTQVERLDRFDREAKLLASLNHSNIATVHGLHQAEGVKFLAMELVRGEDLAERIARGPLPLDEALEIARQVAVALEAAHDSGVVHRDLKPANIRITDDDQVKVLDFGLAKVVAAEVASGESSLAQSPTVTSLGTVAGVILGTASYMSPEQARGKTVDRRADVWAFGAVLYEMLTGQTPFGGETVTDVIAAVVTQEPVWTTLPANTPRSIRRLLERCLRKDPRERLHHIADARLEITDATRDDGDDSATEVGRRSMLDHLGWIVAGFLLVAAFLAYWLPDRGRSNATPQALTFTIPQAGGSSSFPGISPDGRHLVYERGDGLWFRVLDEAEPRFLQGTARGSDPFWTPDSRAIVFVADNELKRVALDGGTPETLARVPGGSIGGSQAVDGTILIEVTESSTDEGWYLLAPGSRKLEMIRAHPRDRPVGPDVARPHFLPDGVHFLFTFPHEGEAYLQLGSIESEETKLLAPAGSRAMYAEPGYVLYVRDGALLAHRFDLQALELEGDPTRIVDSLYFFAPTGTAHFSVSQQGTLVYRGGAGRSNLTWVDRDGREDGTILESATYRHLRVSRDGRQLVTSIRDAKSGTSDIWLVDLEREIPIRFTSAPRTEGWMAWSPDGRHVAFAADWDGPPNIYLREVPDGEARVLVPYDRRVQEPGSWSADGTLLLYEHDSDLEGDIWAVDVESGEREEILATEFDEVDPILSPDGKILAYRSDIAGARDIYLQSFPAGKNRTRLTVGGGNSVRWRDDGQELFYYDPARAYLMAVAVESTGPDRFVVGSETPLFGIRRERFNGYDVLPGGQRFLVVLGEPGSGERRDHVVTDWTRLLDR